jgi:hypothetical protein
MSAKRYTADSITDDALDELYENANKGWRRGDEWKARAEQAEAALEHVRGIARRLAAHAVGFQDALDDTDRDPWARTVGTDISELCSAFDGVPQPGGALSEAERTMLAYALDQAQEKIWSEDGFTDADQAAVDSLRRLAAEPEENSAP